MFHAEHHAAHQRGHRGVETVDLEAFDAAGLRRTAGIVEQAIDTAEFLDRKRDQRLHLLFDRDVGLAKDASGAEFFGQRLAFRHATPGDHDFCAFGDENFRGVQPDAARRAGNDRNFAVQPSHVVSPCRYQLGSIFPPAADNASEHVPFQSGAPLRAAAPFTEKSRISLGLALFWIRGSREVTTPMTKLIDEFRHGWQGISQPSPLFSTGFAVAVLLWRPWRGGDWPKYVPTCSSHPISRRYSSQPPSAAPGSG